MKLIQKIGLVIFILCLAVFVFSLSLSNYKLTPEILDSQITESEGKKYLNQNLSTVYGQVISSKFEFISGIKKGLSQANRDIVEAYSIKETEIDEIISALPNASAFDLSYVDKYILPNNKFNAHKNKVLKEGTGWIVGRPYNSKEEIKAELWNKASELNGSIINQKGIPKHKIDSYVFSITKHSSEGILVDNLWLFFIVCFVLSCFGGLLYIIPQFKNEPPGIKHNGIFFHAAMNRGWLGVVIGTGLILFYIFLYWFPEYLTNWVIMLDPLSRALSGNEASRWFLYGFMYCLAMLVMGVRMVVKYRNNNYQLVRTGSVVFFQLAFAFLIPEILVRMNEPWMDLKNIWPLDYDFFFNINGLIDHPGKLGIFMMVWGIALIIVAVPVFTYFFGKRWYCSWVCGCGGLAETLGDPFRQLSDKSLKAWKIERWMIHSVLVFATVMTGLTLYTYFTGSSSLLGINTYSIQKTYGFLIGSAFAGVVGTGFYPLMGNRVWCRFGCPLAAYLGLVQKIKSRFRITTNGGQCISCGNCSTYCEMGIDVRHYAQKGQNIVRSSCVGCGVCAAVCPRGVLKLENAPDKNRVDDNPIIIGNSGVFIDHKKVEAV